MSCMVMCSNYRSAQGEWKQTADLSGFHSSTPLMRVCVVTLFGSILNILDLSIYLSIWNCSIPKRETKANGHWIGCKVTCLWGTKVIGWLAALKLYCIEAFSRSFASFIHSVTTGANNVWHYCTLWNGYSIAIQRWIIKSDARRLLSDSLSDKYINRKFLKYVIILGRSARKCQ